MKATSCFCQAWGTALLVLATGCGGWSADRATVSGKVTLNNEPVTDGTITFQAAEGPSAGARIVNGEYTTLAGNGPMIGTNKVSISWRKPTGKKVPVGSPAPKGTTMDETAEAIPPQFNKETTLTFDVASGKQSKDFNLTE